MKEFLRVFGFLLRQNLSLKHFFHKLKSDKRQRNLFIVIFVILALSLPSLFFIIDKIVSFFDVLQTMGQESLFIVSGVFVSLFLILIFGIYQVIAYFYFSNEVKVLIPFPIKTKYILLSKFAVVYVWELLISSFLVLPFFIIYGVKVPLGLMHWMYLLLSYILLPIIPLVVVGILTIFMMKITNVSKNKESIRMIGMFLFLVVMIVFQLGFNRMLLQDVDRLTEMLSKYNGIMEEVGNYYPVIKLIQIAITEGFINATLSILVLILISVICIYLFGLFLQTFFLKSYLSEQDNPSKKQKAKKTKDTKVRTVPIAISKIDMRTLLKTPIYAFNCLSMIVILPLFLIVIPIMNTSGGFNIQELYNYVKDYFWLALALGMAAFATLDQIPATTFSREGKTNWIMRTLPISARDNIMGRFLTAYKAQLIFTILTIGILLGILRQDYLMGLIAFILSNIACIPLIFLGIYIDLKRPMLNWENPTQAVKQNMNVLVSMGTGLIYAGLMFGVFKLFNNMVSVPFVYIIFFIINGILGYIMYKLLHAKFNESLVIME